MTAFLWEGKYSCIGYVDPRTILRRQCLTNDEIASIELRRLGYTHHVHVKWQSSLLTSQPDVDYAIEMIGENWSGEWWTAINVVEGQLFAFRNHYDAMLFRMVTP